MITYVPTLVRFMLSSSFLAVRVRRRTQPIHFASFFLSPTPLSDEIIEFVPVSIILEISMPVKSTFNIISVVL